VAARLAGPAAQRDRASGEVERRREHAEDGVRDEVGAASGLARQPDRLAAAHEQVEVLDERPRRPRVGDREAGDAERVSARDAVVAQPRGGLRVGDRVARDRTHDSPSARLRASVARAAIASATQAAAGT
jgi:hypothetical protein